jgi:hypothetical protein
MLVLNLLCLCIHCLLQLLVLLQNLFLDFLGGLNDILDTDHPKPSFAIGGTIKFMSPLRCFHHKWNVKVLIRHLSEDRLIFLKDPVAIDDVSEFYKFCSVFMIFVKSVMLDADLEIVEIYHIISFWICF